MPFDGFLSDDDLRAKAPSIFATHAAPTVSDRYAFIPTYPIVRMLRTIGVMPVEAREGRKRAPDGREYAMHQIRFRKAGYQDKGTRHLGMLVPEVIMLNSHDRTSGVRFNGGIKRLVCLNGMTVMEHGMQLSLRHVGKHIQEAAIGVQTLVGRFDEILEAAESWNNIYLTSEQARQFSDAAVAIRGTSIELRSDVLTARRIEDQGMSLWKVFNRAQENLTRGGLFGRTSTGRRASLRAIGSLAVDDQFNRQLWTLASELAKDIRPAAVSVVAA